MATPGTTTTPRGTPRGNPPLPRTAARAAPANRRNTPPPPPYPPQPRQTPSQSGANPTRTALFSSPAPAPPSTPMQFIDAATLEKILTHSQRKVHYRPQKPRLGGVNETGAWTGMGASKAGIIPRTNNCYRKFDMEPSKNHQQVTLLEKECRSGLRAFTTLDPDRDPNFRS